MPTITVHLPTISLMKIYADIPAIEVDVTDIEKTSLQLSDAGKEILQGFYSEKCVFNTLPKEVIAYTVNLVNLMHSDRMLMKIKENIFEQMKPIMLQWAPHRVHGSPELICFRDEDEMEITNDFHLKVCLQNPSNFSAVFRRALEVPCKGTLTS